MERKFIKSTEYLKGYLEGGLDLPGYVLLPHEGAAVDRAVAKQSQAFEEVVKQKIEVSGGDDWHDGAFRATDNEAKIVSQQMSAIAPFIGAVVVEYPDVSETRATLGSRLTIVQNGFTYPADIVGFRAGYPENIIDEQTGEEVVAISPESPLARSVIGMRAGEDTIFSNGGRDMNITVATIDQLAVKSYFTDHLPTLEITD